MVEKFSRPGDDLGAAHGIVAAGPGRAAILGNRIRAVQRIVERAPARIGGVQRVARVHDGHDQLRSGDAGDLVVDIGRLDLEIRPFRHEVADLGQHRFVGRGIVRLAFAGDMPRVDLGLHFGALGDQRAIAGAEVVDQAIEPGPEFRLVDSGSRQGLARDEVGPDRRDLQAALRTRSVINNCP